MDHIWIWLIAGLFPYSIKREQTNKGRALSVRALFWWLIIHWHKGRCSWEIYIPLIEHLRHS